MNVTDAAHVRPRGVDPGVDPELGVRRPLALNPIAADVHEQQAVLACQGRTGPSRDEERLRARDPSADVSVRGHQPYPVDDVIRQDDVSLQRIQVWRPHPHPPAAR